MASRVSPPRRSLYPLEDTGKWMHQLREQYKRILTPLSLFPTTFSRLKPSLSGPSLGPPEEEELPVPISLSALMQLVKARLKPGPQEANAHPQHLRTFQDIILTEVKHAHKHLQHLLHDPAFSPDTNRELYQHLLTYLGLVCQHLFRHYLGLMECCRLRHIFTDCANLIRFSAQLALDCSKFLNVVAVRQRLVWEMKRQVDRPTDSPTKPSSPFGPMTTHSLGNRLGITISYFISYIRPHMLTEKEKVAQDLKELEELPLLDMSKIKKLNLPTARKANFLQQMACVAITPPCPHVGSRSWSRPQILPATSVLLKCQSLPNMRVGKLLADELGIHLIPRRISPDLLCRCPESPEVGELKGPAALAEDLQRLVRGSHLENTEWKGEQDDLDLPPLIRALTWSKANENRQLHLQRMLKSLHEEERFETKRRNTIIAAPASHPQAATVNVRIHDRMVVKTADLQVSERHYLENVTMDRSLPIYNHLLGEITPATMKILDANLSTGEEVKEIYKELMNTIPKDHLKFDQGSLIECPATNLPHDSCFASSTLTKRKSEQIINTELSQILPDGPFVPEEMVEAPQPPNLTKKKLASKEYASWLKWWKATFNIDDYFKYISNNTADYLPVIFHLYNPEEDSKEGKERDMQAVLNEDEVKKQKVKRKQLKAAELQSQKLFRTGLWNVSSTRLEGLGSSTSDRFEEFNVLQRRLERLWTVLHFSERERLDMAIKYSSNQYYLLLPDMLNSWEVAAQFIQDRELLLAEIEEFEQTASDPNRLFSKELGAFATRRQESNLRSQLQSELDQYNFELRLILKHINDAFNDIVTFKGRPYQDKMERDIVEMLYWLQQERRAVVLRKAVQRKRSGRLSPLS
ncbi:coiled-coil domain-containing protein 87 [Notechis scutatus]|uniref:Coiled-coil domain-containing protein 87 n=1 Tax=Notechis scutatus TaxID=8663 RepID=A0A6J1VD46_9SAUR|nr:coiled-coil domain-containing protein 87 [Notechis scutatus]